MRRPQLKHTSRLLQSLTEMTYPDLLIRYLMLSITFGGIYFALSMLLPAHGLAFPVQHPDKLMKLLDSIYFSFVTVTTIGYGDINPMGISKLLAPLQAVAGLLTFGVLLSKLISTRAEQTLADIHRLTFENIFNNIREGLFIDRHDIDAVIHTAEERGKLTPRDWNNLSTAFLHAQSLIGDVPNFYDAEQHLYTIDQRRERLLLEGIDRTLHRIDLLLACLKRKRISWKGQTDTKRELSNCLITVRDVTPIITEHSPHRIGNLLKDIAAEERRLSKLVQSYKSRG